MAGEPLREECEERRGGGGHGRHDHEAEPPGAEPALLALREAAAEAGRGVHAETEAAEHRAQPRAEGAGRVHQPQHHRRLQQRGSRGDTGARVLTWVLLVLSSM